MTNKTKAQSYTSFYLLFLAFLLGNTALLGQGYLRTDGQEIVNENGDPVLLRGMGLGGWMLQEGYMLQTASFANPQYQIRAKIEELIGTADTDLFYETWLANHVRKIDIDSLKAWGFNSVRLPMHYNLFTLPIEEEPVPGENTWLEKGFELTDSLVAWCAQNEMYVILDLHAAPGGQGMDAGISDYDPTKPSLWESVDNQKKTVALWKRLAEHYVDEPWIGGYDLLNETNWSMDGNIPLRDLYYEITDSIRAVDDKHMIIIEGNWFANDFTNLTPPWDDNMVYSPHKYWSINDQASIQWVLDIRETYDVPLYFGECGENSNTWFRDAISLFEDFNIGWAWWPMKKIESIAGPLSVPKTEGYETLLDYWNNGGTQPTQAFAKAALMEVANNLKLENCIYQKDVIDAMFRQVNSEEAVPFNTQSIPGIVYATDFDMGPDGVAYSDIDIANYQVSTGNYTAWNQGWSYRNDGVDIEVTEDNMNTNGYNVGWIGTGEWMQYDVDVEESGIYDINVRIAANGSEGRFHFASGEADITGSIAVPYTGGWQTWQTVTVQDVILSPEDNKLRFYCDSDGYNLNSFQFVQQGSSTSIPAQFLSAITLTDNTVQLNLNKPLVGPIPASPANFTIYVNGFAVPITSTVLNSDNTRMITFTVDAEFRSEDAIRISYSGDQIDATDGTTLSTFSLQIVQNTVAIIHPIPGRVEAEDYFFNAGFQLETTTDIGGGQNIGFLDVGDYADYYINVGQAGTYSVEYRTAALSESGQIRLELIDANGDPSILHIQSFPSTGGWQDWTSTTATAVLPAGLQQIRLNITQPLFNMNWFEFSFVSSTEELSSINAVELFPNPNNGQFILKGSLENSQDLVIQVINTLGQVVYTREVESILEFQEQIDLSAQPDGQYFIHLIAEDSSIFTHKFVKL